MSIKAIQTQYKNYKFRSRLEARWAVWLDAMGVDWTYEPQGYDLDGELYLPDFFLRFKSGERFEQGVPPYCGYWLEIKPGPLTEREELLLAKLATETKHRAYAFAGDPWPGEFMFYHTQTHPNGRVLMRSRIPGECWLCDGTGMEANKVPLRRIFRGVEFLYMAAGECRECDGKGVIDPLVAMNICNWWLWFLQKVSLRHSSSILLDAFRAARQARFEHGESPTTRLNEAFGAKLRAGMEAKKPNNETPR